MSVITAIFQAIFQAICWILPISESGHSAIFHDFSNRFSGACSSLTGIVHIGIAVGIVVALYKLFFTLSKELVGTAIDLVKKSPELKRPKPARRFMLMSLISFLPMILLLIPVGKGRMVFDILTLTQHNGTLLDEGICFGIMGALIILASSKLSKATNNKDISVIMAIAIGFASAILVSVSGLSLIIGIVAILILLGVSKKLSYRYAMVISVPVLLVMGIVEIVTSVTKIGVVPAIIGAIISAVLSYFLTTVLRALINKNNIKYFGYYDIALGVIVLIVGIFELILR